MNPKLIISSEDELIRVLRTRLAARAPQIIGMDGLNGAGKSSLARHLGAIFDCPVVECDLFMREGKLAYPKCLDLASLKTAISVAAERNPVFVEGVMMQLVMSALALTPSLSIYVRHSWPRGALTHSELFDPKRSEEGLIAEENELCQAAGIADEEPILARELIRYHKQRAPHEHADILFESSFSIEEISHCW